MEGIVKISIDDFQSLDTFRKEMVKDNMMCVYYNYYDNMNDYNIISKDAGIKDLCNSNKTLVNEINELKEKIRELSKPKKKWWKF